MRRETYPIDAPISVTVSVWPDDLMALGRLTGSGDARQTIEEVIRMTVEMVEGCNGETY